MYILISIGVLFNNPSVRVPPLKVLTETLYGGGPAVESDTISKLGMFLLLPIIV